jgi:hypothetical protein
MRRFILKYQGIMASVGAMVISSSVALPATERAMNMQWKIVDTVSHVRLIEPSGAWSDTVGWTTASGISDYENGDFRFGGVRGWWAPK